MVSAHSKWRRNNPERAKQSDHDRRKRYVLKNPKRALLKNIKGRAKAAGIEFNLSEIDIDWPDICPVLGILLGTGSLYNTRSVDRINNNLGYIPGNVRVISWRANSIKSDATLEELLKVVEYVRAHQKECVSFVD